MPRSQRIEPIDPAVALRWYAALAGLAGFTLAGWGPIWLGSELGGNPWGKAALIRMSGAIVIAAGICALGLSEGDALTRRRAVSWFIAAHAVVWLMLVVQILGPWDAPLAYQVSWALLAVILGLAYVRIPTEPAAVPPVSILHPAQGANGADAARSRYEQQIRDLAAQEERNRLARDLHDAIKQQVFAIQTSAAAAEERFDREQAGAREALAQVRQSAREAMAEMEAMLDHLRVVPIENAGLVEAIRKQCEALAFRTGAQVDVQLGQLPQSDAFEPGAHQTIFRITQEALANIGRHARAHHVWVSIAASNGQLEVKVDDDGVGFATGASPGGMGIQNMAARAAELKGTIAVGRRPAGGTRVTLSIPYETVEAITYRRKRALALAAIFGAIGAAAFARLLTDGFVFGSVFVVLFTVGFVHNLLLYWRLRDAGRRRAATSRPAS